MTDMPLALGVVLTMVGFHLGTGGVGVPDRRWALAGFGGLAIGLLAKGPIALVLFGLPVAVWLTVARRWSSLRHLPWGTGLLLVAVTVLPWYAAAEIKTPGFLRYFIIGEHFERFVVPGWEGDLYGSGHERPKGIIWLYGLATFLPWTLFALAPLFRARRIRRPDGDGGLYLYLALFALAPLIVFTPAANILAAYALPGLPAAAALLAIAWTDAGLSTRRGSFTALAVAAMAVPLILAAVFLSGNDRTWPLRTAYGAIHQLNAIAPEAHLWTFDDRIFSASYYADGKARTVASGDVPRLRGDSARDAIIVRDKDGSKPVPDGFDDLGTWTSYRLWLERIHG